VLQWQAWREHALAWAVVESEGKHRETRDKASGDHMDQRLDSGDMSSGQRTFKILSLDSYAEVVYYLSIVTQ
jgi:hypothetical protein